MACYLEVFEMIAPWSSPEKRKHLISLTKGVFTAHKLRSSLAAIQQTFTARHYFCGTTGSGGTKRLWLAAPRFLAIFYQLTKTSLISGLLCNLHTILYTHIYKCIQSILVTLRKNMSEVWPDIPSTFLAMSFWNALFRAFQNRQPKFKNKHV